MRNEAISGTAVITTIGALLRNTLPVDWRLDVQREVGRGANALIVIGAPRGERATVALEAKDRLEPNVIPAALAHASRGADAVMLAAPFLSERSRALVIERGGGYADATGNLRLRLDRPAVFIKLEGARSNPWPDRDEPLRTLKGPGAARVVRGLCELRPPYGVREVANRSRSSVSTTSRVLALLDRDALIDRGGSSRIVSVDWQSLLRRWAQDYSLTGSNRAMAFIEPRGLPALLKKLSASGLRYSVTGSLAAAARGPLAAPRLGVVYVADTGLAAEELRLREVDDGANVMLLEPLSDVVFDRTWVADGVEYAGMAQVAVDLLTSPGRGPSEAEDVIRWMESNEDAWRA